MWHQGDGEAADDGGSGWSRKRRALLYVLVGFVVAYFFLQNQINNSKSEGGKYACEVAHGAGNCVKSGGEWVRRGSSPLFGP